MKKKILVITDHMPWGHRSIARAIFGHFKLKEKKNDWVVKYVEVKAETGIANDVYTFLCRYMPLTHRIVHKFAALKMSVELGEDLAMRSLPRLEREIRWFKPDLIISTYFLHSWAIAKWRQKEIMKFKLWTIVADPWSINPISFIDLADKNVVYDEKGKKMAIEKGVTENKILVTGWWVRQEMYKDYDRAAIRRKMGINDNRPVVFVGGGSLGTSSLIKLLPALLMVKKKVGVLFNTGTDKLAYNMVEEYMKLYRKLISGNLVIVKNLGWVENMAEILSAVDIVFGKAGPNFLFDAIARKKPFVAITHIGGQEDGNIELIRKKKLGWVKERGGSMVDFFLEFVEDPKKILDKFKKSIELESRSNQKGLENLENAVLKELK